MSEILTEIAAGHGEPLSRAARRIPSTRRNRPVSLGCLLRWVTDGVLGPDGQRVRLEAARCAGRWLTTPQAIARFLAAQTPPTSDKQAATPAPRTPTARSRAAARAARQLEAAGI